MPFLTDQTTAIVAPSEPEDPADDERATKTLAALRGFLDSTFLQIKSYAEYVRGEAPFATHQGVKGLEFPRVAVILDDEGAGDHLAARFELSNPVNWPAVGSIAPAVGSAPHTNFTINTTTTHFNQTELGRLQHCAAALSCAKLP